MDPFPTAHKPGIVIFDLDFTVWPYWADSHLSPPFSKADDVIKDSGGETLLLYPDIPKILEFLKHHEVPMAVASKSAECSMYKDLLKLFGIYQYFEQFEIYKLNKNNHMKAIREGQNKEYSDMLFFDDKWHNITTTRDMGVTAVHLPDQGVTWDIFVDGLKKHEIDWKHQPKTK